MTNKERIKELEQHLERLTRRLADLEARPPMIQPIYVPYPQPQFVPTVPWWHNPIVTCDNSDGRLTASAPHSPDPFVTYRITS